MQRKAFSRRIQKAVVSNSTSHMFWGWRHLENLLAIIFTNTPRRACQAREFVPVVRMSKIEWLGHPGHAIHVRIRDQGDSRPSLADPHSLYTRVGLKTVIILQHTLEEEDRS